MSGGLNIGPHAIHSSEVGSLVPKQSNIIIGCIHPKAEITSPITASDIPVLWRGAFRVS